VAGNVDATVASRRMHDRHANALELKAETTEVVTL
jgi:hypothetical protein